jgi:nucleotide-binding universal stress UspA family protein
MSGIVLGYDDSAAARAAMTWTCGQAQLTRCPVEVVYVISSVSEWELAAIQVNTDPMRRAFEERLRGPWTEPLRRGGVAFSTHVTTGSPAKELLKRARAVSADLIVIGMTAHGTLTELVTRNTMRELRGHAVRPVVAVPAEWQAGAPADGD